MSRMTCGPVHQDCSLEQRPTRRCRSNSHTLSPTWKRDSGGAVPDLVVQVVEAALQPCWVGLSGGPGRGVGVVASSKARRQVQLAPEQHHGRGDAGGGVGGGTEAHEDEWSLQVPVRLRLIGNHSELAGHPEPRKDIVYKGSSNDVCVHARNGDGLGPPREIVHGDQQVAVAARGEREGSSDVHSNTFPWDTNIVRPQGSTASLVWALLPTTNLTGQTPEFYLLAHAWPVEVAPHLLEGLVVAEVARPSGEGRGPNADCAQFARFPSHTSHSLTRTVMTVSSPAGRSVLDTAHTRSDEEMAVGCVVRRVSGTRWRPLAPCTNISSLAGLNCSTYAAMKSPPRSTSSWMSPSKTYIGTSKAPNETTAVDQGLQLPQQRLGLVAGVLAAHRGDTDVVGRRRGAGFAGSRGIDGHLAEARALTGRLVQLLYIIYLDSGRQHVSVGAVVLVSDDAGHVRVGDPRQEHLLRDRLKRLLLPGRVGNPRQLQYLRAKVRQALTYFLGAAVQLRFGEGSALARVEVLLQPGTQLGVVRVGGLGQRLHDIGGSSL
ncbi:NAD kinase 2 [Frankliniella fusca]|uniref:NAD kinase 2 n=1 Tax=Frankliniella fusca TaxID=407009 RepID=A0AAE1I1C7_9NEOP|nr:NAD kinase 2 [Frankliniella fusca]